MRKIRMVLLGALAVSLFAVMTATASAASNVSGGTHASSHALVKAASGKYKVNEYEFCEEGYCQYEYTAPKYKEWELESGVYGHYFKSGKYTYFVFESEYNYGCAFVDRKKGKNYYGYADESCYYPGLYNEMLYLGSFKV